MATKKAFKYGYKKFKKVGKKRLKLYQLNPKKAIRDIGLIITEDIAINPSLKKIFTVEKGSAEYKRLIKETESVSTSTYMLFREFTEKLGDKDPIKTLKRMTNDPQGFLEDLNQMSPAQQKELAKSMEAVTNESALSSSWLAYGTFIPTNINNPEWGVIHLTTKDGEKFKTPTGPKSIWDEMVKQIGITHYDKHGKRKGSEYGAGTVLWKYYPRKTWKRGK